MERRLLSLLLVVAALTAPALVLRALCVGRACERPQRASAPVPFCSLDPALRRLVLDGFVERRGPDVMAVTGDVAVAGASGLRRLAPPWPSEMSDDRSRVPLVFAGPGVSDDARIPSGTGLASVAPTIAEIIELERPHPEVRSGRAVEGVSAGTPPRLVLEVVWKGVGSADLEAARGQWPFLRSLLGDGAGTLDAEVGSLPLDPVAVLATIGTGGLPREHGITGTELRNDRGRLVRAWGRGAPFSIIAALGDDLDEVLGQEPRIGVVGTDPADRGVVGGNWYVEHDRDDAAFSSRTGRQLASVERHLATGYGADDTPDLLAVVLEGRIRDLDDALVRLMEAARRASGGSVAVVVTSTGSTSLAGEAVPAETVARSVDAEVRGPVTEATAVGGLFVDQEAVTRPGISEDRVLSALRGLEAAGGAPLFEDVFPAIAVTFARYC